jgi:DNA recombination protein RmuC
MDFILLVSLLVLMAGVIILQIAWRPNRESIETLRNLASRFDQLRNEQLRYEELLRSELLQSRQETSAQARDNRTEIFDMMTKLSTSNEAKLEQIRTTVDGRLSQLRDENAQRLDQMRLTVDEKLQGTLEKRLGDSFRQVNRSGSAWTERSQ